MSNREVAEDLGIQEKTVKHYMTSILEKLHARNRVEAALIARDAWATARYPHPAFATAERDGRRSLRRQWLGSLATTEETGARQKGRRAPRPRALHPPASASIRSRSAAVAGRSTTVLSFGSFSS